MYASLWFQHAASKYPTAQDMGALAPATLAAEALDVMPLGNAAITFYGSSLASVFEDMIGVKGSYYIVIAALVAAVLAGHGALCLCGAIVVACGVSLVLSVVDLTQRRVLRV
jgi:hypothetical protein